MGALQECLAILAKVGTLSEILHAAPSLRGPFKAGLRVYTSPSAQAPPVWTGKPWGDVLNAAQSSTKRVRCKRKRGTARDSFSFQ